MVLIVFNVYIKLLVYDLFVTLISSMKLICSTCQCVLKTIKFLIVHIKKFHPLEAYSALKCPVTNCIKICPSLQAFRRHFIKCYSQAGDTSHNMKLSVNTTLERTTIEQPNKSVSPAFSTDDKINQTNISENLDIISYYFKKILVESSLVFLSKLYASNTLNRTHVQEIVDTVSEL